MMCLRESRFIQSLWRVARSPLPVVAVLLLVQAAAWGSEWAEENFPAWQTVSDDELNAVRGGFLFSNGVQVDIGIQKAAFVKGFEEFRNGFEEFRKDFKQFRTRFNVPDKTQGRILDEANSAIQVGTGNALNGLEIPSGSTFIQNTLDNQFLSNFTVVDVRIRNLDTAVRQLPVSAFPAIQDFTIPGLAP